MQIEKQKKTLFCYLFFLTGLFILLEISFFIQGSDLYLGDFIFISRHLQIPMKILPGILYFLAIQILLHLIFTLWIGFAACLISRVLRCSWKQTELMAFSLWFMGIITLLLANQCFFPNSKFALLFEHFLNPTVAQYLFFILLFFLLLALLMSLLGLFLLWPKKMMVILVGSLFATLVLAIKAKDPIIKDGATLTRPNIIFIGIDSLRPDFVSFFGNDKKTPHLDFFLNQASVFSNAYTPLARTFPAWISILTGQFPKINGVRFNLPTLENFDWDHTLPSILKKQGYTTWFATDEVRFSNIDERFGFDKTITPPIGVNDFLLGDLTDFPLMNLLVNTKLGQWLFPYSFANRPVFVTYDPNSFLNLLKKNLPVARTTPFFLAVHFCLPHYPYFWGKQAFDDKPLNNYRASIKRVDQQFQDFFTLLQQTGFLKHAIVVLLSDHGEAIELPGDRVTSADLFIPGKNNFQKSIPHFYPPSFAKENVNQSAGHGTDVLGLTQYHIVLAFRLFGMEKNKVSIHAERVSLVNLKATMLNFLQQSCQDNSLMNLILGKAEATIPSTHLFIESDFSPQAVRTVHPETHRLLFEGIDFFQIDPKSTRVYVKKSMVNLIISSKQYADLYGHWILALYPQNKTEMMPILVNLDTGEWTNDLRISFALKSPAYQMVKALKHFYGNEVTHIQNFTT